MAQNWSNLMYYINNKLASNVNALELTNADLQAIVANVTLPEFSTFNPEPRLYMLTMDKLVSSLNKYTFKIPVATENFTIVRVEQAYYATNDSNNAFDGISAAMLSNPIDTAMSAQSSDVRASLQTVRTYDFFPPDTIAFNQRITTSLILDLAIEHTSPSTVQSDLYHKLFKKLALRDVLDNIIMTRSKYSNLSTPIGQIELNIDALMQIRDRINDEVKETEDNLPPEQMITFL